jgi:hypothetical protein
VATLIESEHKTGTMTMRIIIIVKKDRKKSLDPVSLRRSNLDRRSSLDSKNGLIRAEAPVRTSAWWNQSELVMMAREVS